MLLTPCLKSPGRKRRMGKVSKKIFWMLESNILWQSLIKTIEYACAYMHIPIKKGQMKYTEKFKRKDSYAKIYKTVQPDIKQWENMCCTKLKTKGKGRWKRWQDVLANVLYKLELILQRELDGKRTEWTGITYLLYHISLVKFFPLFHTKLV